LVKRFAATAALRLETCAGLIVAGLCVQVISALLAGRPFYGENYKGLPLGAYSTLVVIVVVAAVGLFIGVHWIGRRLRRASNDRRPAAHIETSAFGPRA
jgi:hypothetical protein